MAVHPAIIPGLVYDDAPAAIAFLCDAFGFRRGLIVPGERADEIAHAQLTLGEEMIMIASATAGARTRFGLVSSAATGGLVTAYVNVVLDDPDAHHARAAAAGAVVITPPHDNDYGGRGYEVRDCGGNVWSFGSYDPWA